MTSPDAFFISSKFWLSGLCGKKWSKMTKRKLSHSISQELYLIWFWFLVHMCKMMMSPAIFFYFFKIQTFWVFQSSLTNAKRKFWDVPHPLHMWLIFLRSRCCLYQRLHSFIGKALHLIKCKTDTYSWHASLYCF